jgi:hypothetical protein
MSLIEVPFPDLPMQGQSTQSAPLEVSGRIRIGKRACRYRTITGIDWPETGFEEISGDVPEADF